MMNAGLLPGVGDDDHFGDPGDDPMPVPLPY